MRQRQTQRRCRHTTPRSGRGAPTLVGQTKVQMPSVGTRRVMTMPGRDRISARLHPAIGKRPLLAATERPLAPAMMPTHATVKPRNSDPPPRKIRAGGRLKPGSQPAVPMSAIGNSATLYWPSRIIWMAVTVAAINATLADNPSMPSSQLDRVHHAHEP